MVQRKIKRYKPKRRHKTKVVKTISNHTFILPFSFFIFVAAILIFVDQKKTIIFDNYKKISPFSNTIQKISSHSNISKVEQEVYLLLSSYIGKEFSKKLREEIPETLKKNLPYISDVKVKFNPVLSKLTIDIEAEKSIAYLMPLNKYHLESGRLSDLSVNDDLITVECIECNIDKTNLKIISKLSQTKELPLPNCQAVVKKNTLNLICNNILIEWGDERYFKNKIEKLKYVIEDAKNKLGDSFKVDLRFFADGKIIVSKIKTDLKK